MCLRWAAYGSNIDARYNEKWKTISNFRFHCSKLEKSEKGCRDMMHCYEMKFSNILQSGFATSQCELESAVNGEVRGVLIKGESGCEWS